MSNIGTALTRFKYTTIQAVPGPKGVDGSPGTQGIPGQPAPVVGTMAQLRATSPAVPSALLSGFHTAHDGGGSLFVWDGTDSRSDDGGTIIQVTGLPTGRWNRSYSGPIDPKWFGAKGDGATDDHAALVAADAAAAASGNRVRLAPGGYHTTGSLTFSADWEFGSGAAIDGTLTFSGSITAHERQQIFFNNAVVTLTRMVAAPRLSVMWWGAVGDGVVDDTASIQACLDSGNTALATLLGVLGSGAVESSLEIFFPSGAYKVTSELTVYGYQHLTGNRKASLVAAAGASFSILRIFGYLNKIRGLLFSGGKHHISVYGPSAHLSVPLGSPGNGGGNYFEECEFRYANGVSFFIDHTPIANGGSWPVGTFTSSSASFHFSKCEGYGPCFFYGTSDGVYYDSSCYYTLDTLSVAAVLDDNGKALGAFNSGGHLSFDGMFGVPNSNSGIAWLQGTGIFKARDMRFGGEGTCVAIRGRQVMPYNGHSLPLGWESASEWHLDVNEITCSVNTNWAEFYDVMPRAVTLRRSVASFDTIAQEEVASLGLWVDATSIGIAAIQNNLDIRQLQIVIEGNEGIYASRMRMSTNPAVGDAAGTIDLVPVLRRHINGYLPPQGELPRNNLGVQMQLDGSSGTYWTATDTATRGGITDAGLGYTTIGIHATADGQFTESTSTYAWNGPAGEYTFSVYVKSTYGGKLWLGNGIAIGRIADMPDDGHYKRIGMTFWHDGANAKLFIVQVFDMPSGGAVYWKLPMINRGSEMAPYVYPVDSENAPTTSLTVEDVLPKNYYGTAAPTVASPYIVGDRMWNTVPTAGGTLLWVCTTSGSPGTWKPVAIGA